MSVTPPAGRAATGATRTVYQVSELAQLLRSVVEGALPRIWVQGEISNFSRPASGHWYFTLKDARAQLRCAMFKNANLHVRPQPRDGDAVLIRAQLSFYTARGDLQLICEHMEPAGEGALLRAFEELKRRLASEGLFDEHLKREIPKRPRAIGLITSGSGAALHDMCTTLARRYPVAPVYLFPVPVQGTDAPPAIVRALRRLPQLAPVDVILLARGGGSLEDLWAFNDEHVARAIRACSVPVICGVGHEVDVTIADFAADLRAPTPTAAAERAAPDIAEWQLALRQSETRMAVAVERRLQLAAQRCDDQARRLDAQHPGRRLHERRQRLDELQLRLRRAQTAVLARHAQRLAHRTTQLQAATPLRRLTTEQHRLERLQARAGEALRRRLGDARARLLRSEAPLSSLNPLAVLERGYAIALDADGRAVTDAAKLQPGDALSLRLSRGRVTARVDRTEPDGAESGPNADNPRPSR
ncbi:exodeoxyribonuclease VII large subunit [Solimonas marina]|uniref:Exodeoxyribonuclease 7 large subunit n=1 Tax=Solimonas marina TaxID=2714601 RepID=A0A970B7E5_9GAMM|nr:exodeoxyribonuclease VII large subunit [Solimonas marina]NKF23813.1 exodeoxyribonuclease VII large subunit [Solimonas marina]